jgi:NodT family efflux transporter outer membrane factor (OMF) lipoprotein
MDNFLRPAPLALALLLALASGAATAADSGVAVPERFAAASAVDEAAPQASIEFWQRFEDPQLSALVEQSLRANHDLRIALGRLDSANALLRGARLEQLPSLRGEADATDARLSADQAPGVAREDRDGRSYSAGARLSWEIDLFGRVRKQVASQRAQANALSSDLRALQVSIVSEVAHEYFALRGAQARLQVAQDNAKAQEETLQLVDRGVAAGRGTAFDAARTRAQWENTSARVPAIQSEIALSEHRLSVLTGQVPEALVAELNVSANLPALPDAPAAGTPGELLRRRPDIAAAESRLASATARVGVAKADYFPRFTLGGLIGSQSIARGDLFSRDSETRLVALGIDWSFLDVGRVRARVAAAGADAEVELARYQQTVLTALQETEDALVRGEQSRIEEGHLQRAAEQSTRAGELARVRFKAGVGTLLDVLDAERSRLQAQEQLALARVRSLDGSVDLYRALAGGWPDRLPERQALSSR